MFVETKTDGEVIPQDEWRDSFLKAAELLEQKGWCQGTACNAAGEHCLLGAIWYARYGHDAPHGPVPSKYKWGEVFDRVAPYTARHPADWNDTPGRTKEEVIAALRAAAAH